MKWLIRSGVALCCLAVLGVTAWAADETRSFQVKNRLRLEYDDNIYETAQDKEESFKVIEEIEFLVNLNLPQTYLGLRYRPSFEYWDNRDPDNEDWFHDIDLVLTHNFTERLSLSIKDTFRVAEQPEAIDRGTIVRENNDFVYNVADGKLSYLINRQTRIEAGYRNTLLRYDDEDIANTEDFDINAAGATVRHQLKAGTMLAGDYRYEAIAYEGPDRDSESHYLGAGLEQVFTPNLLGNIRAGYQMKDFSSDEVEDSDDPYADASLTFMPSPKTRLTGGAGYSMFESDVYPFASQDRSVLFLSLAHDLTAKVSLYASGSYQLSEYNADQQIEEAFAEDGDETVWQGSARASYKINRNNWLEIGYNYLDLASDFREEFDRNRIDLGWRTQL